MSLPTITPLQFAVLTKVMSFSLSGEEIRKRLQQDGIKSEGPAFCQLMKRMEDKKLVKGHYETIYVPSKISPTGQKCRIRVYKIMAGGKKAVMKFYHFLVQIVFSGP